MAKEEEPIVDTTLLRQDVLDYIKLLDDIQGGHLQEYLKKNANSEVDMSKLGMKLHIGNRQWILEGDAPKGLLTQEEILFIAQFGRHDMDNTVIPNRPVPDDAVFESIKIESIPAEWQTTPKVAQDAVILYFHGGAFVMGSPKSHRVLTVALGRAASMKVLSVDYRLAPEHSCPAAIEDALASYEWLLSEGYDPSRIVIAGDSAGGYLTLSVLLRLRDGGNPLPAAGVCLSPVTDLTFTHESFFSNAKTDPMIGPGGCFWMIEAYLGSEDPSDKDVSPLFADLEGLPPMLFQASKIEMVYSDSVRFVEKARAAGVDVTLQTWNDMIHSFQTFDFPEAYEAIDKAGTFMREHIL